MLFVSFNMWTTHPSASSFLTSATPESIRPDATRSWAVEVHWSRPQVCVLLPNCMNWIFWVQKTELYEETKKERATLLASGWWFLLKSTMNHTSWSRILWSLIKWIKDCVVLIDLLVKVNDSNAEMGATESVTAVWNPLNPPPVHQLIGLSDVPTMAFSGKSLWKQLLVNQLKSTERLTNRILGSRLIVNTDIQSWITLFHQNLITNWRAEQMASS